MKKVVMLCLAMLFITGSSMIAQKGDPKTREEEKAKKEAFLKEKLGLTESEAKAFWPLFYQMKDELKENHKNFKQFKPKKGTKIDDMSDADVEKMIDAGFEMKEKDLAIHKRYNQKFIDQIGVKKTAKLYHLERAYRRSKKEPAKEK